MYRRARKGPWREDMSTCPKKTSDLEVKTSQGPRRVGREEEINTIGGFTKLVETPENYSRYEITN